MECLLQATSAWISSAQTGPNQNEYCIKGNVNVCLIFQNLPNGLETGKIKTLSLIIYVGMLWQTIFVLRLSNTAVYLGYSLAQQMAPYVI